MGDINLGTKVNNLDERVSEIESSLIVESGELTSIIGNINLGNTSLMKYGKVVVLGLMQTDINVTSNTWTVISKLPDKFCPANPINLIGLIGGKMGRIQINSNGNIQIYNSETVNNAQVLCGLTWII